MTTGLYRYTYAVARHVEKDRWTFFSTLPRLFSLWVSGACVGKHMIAKKYGSLELHVEVPDKIDNHRCQYARDIIADRSQFTKEMAEDMVIHYFSPTRKKESSTVYEMKARLFFDGDSDE